jgi:hypothetical protein
MKQQQQQQQLRPVHEFEVPAARHSAQDEAFGRTFHPPPDNPHAESSLISGLSGGASASAVSGMSGISALTDPMSSVSNSDGFQSRASRLAQLDRIRSNWAAPSNITSSDNTPTAQLLNASNGIGSSINNSGVMNVDQMDDNMSWTHSLHGGGIGSIVEETIRDDSVLGGATESILSAGSVANFSLGGLSATSGGVGMIGESNHTTLSNPLRSERIVKNNVAGPAAYYSCDASVTSGMSLGGYSVSELSENLVALDLSNNVLGPLHENEI